MDKAVEDMNGGLILNALNSRRGGGGSIAPKPDTITQNGIYYASTDNLDGYSQVVVDVPTGGGIAPIDSLQTLQEVALTQGFTVKIKFGNALNRNALIQYGSQSYYGTTYKYVKTISDAANKLYICLYQSGNLIWAVEDGRNISNGRDYAIIGSNPSEYKLFLYGTTETKSFTADTPQISITWIDSSDHSKGISTLRLTDQITYVYTQKYYDADGTVISSNDYTDVFSISAQFMSGFWQPSDGYINGDVSLFDTGTAFLKSTMADEYVIDEFYVP